MFSKEEWKNTDDLEKFFNTKENDNYDDKDYNYDLDNVDGKFFDLKYFKKYNLGEFLKINEEEDFLNDYVEYCNKLGKKTTLDEKYKEEYVLNWQKESNNLTNNKYLLELGDKI